MTPRRLSRFTTFLLHVLLRRQEPVAGDLLEEFGAGRSRTWLWRQALAAAALAPGTEHGLAAPLGLREERDVTVVTRASSCTGAIERAVNLTGSPVHGIGGLGLVVLGTLVTMVRPDAWTFALYGPIGGVLVALTLGTLRRHRDRDPATTRLVVRG